MQTSDWSWGDEEFPVPESPVDPSQGTPPSNKNPQPEQPASPQTNAYGEPKNSRKCRICLEWVPPTYEGAGMLDGIRNRRPKRHYISDDGDRLISPCHCKGSIKYLHEGCLKMWMNENPRKGFECGICKYKYKLERLSWAQRLRSPVISLLMTVAIMVVTIFLLGFVADPILGLWLDPVGTIADTVMPASRFSYDEFEIGDESGWFEHLLKGVFSLGLIGFVKAFLVMSPWQWWNLRTSGIVSGGGGRRGGTGRDRMENINLTLVLIGVLTFLYTVWKATRKYTEKTLDRASQKILNVQQGDPEDSDDEYDHI